MSLRYIDQGDYAVAVVGAASGIGLTTAQFLAGQGARVACLDRNKEGVEAAAKSLGGKAMALAVDVTDWNAVKDAIDSVARQFGKIDALVNCAGVTGKTNVPAHEVEIDDFDFVYRINLKGAFLLSKAVLPHMLSRKFGRILHVASIAGKDGNAGMAAYSATKAGLIGLVKTLGKDYAESGITINGLAPAVIRTPMVDALPQATVDYMTAKIPMRRCGELQEAAELIGWIVSPACSFTTGFTFDLTGGRATY
ncbi:MAG TPA: SDR family NAD(P)-dependent oxidoreductase [Candidatus Binatia bacterium]|nr:SDR family NAD(P)-dependent oxidoreductase [Candidatus Binatia bacterium]